jgi:hypothetical protein
MTPKEYKQMMDYLTRSGIRKQIKFASDIARPDPKPEIKEIEAINAFMRRNPRADGGRIGFADGTTSKTQTKIFKYPKKYYNSRTKKVETVYSKNPPPSNVGVVSDFSRAKSEASFKAFEDKFGKKLLNKMAQSQYGKNFRELDKNNELKFFKNQVNKYEDFIKENKRYPNKSEAYSIGLKQSGKRASPFTDEIKNKIKNIYTSGKGGSTYISKKLAEEGTNIDDSTIRRFLTAEEQAGRLKRPKKFQTQAADPTLPADRYNIVREVTDRDLRGFTVGRSGAEVLAPKGSKYKITFKAARTPETSRVPLEYQGTQYYKTKTQADNALKGYKKFSKDLKKTGKAGRSLRDIILRDISDPNVESAILRLKEGEDLATAHRLSYKQVKKLGQLYNIANLGVEDPAINSGAIRRFENKLERLYEEQRNLIKTAKRSTNKNLPVPKNLQDKIDLNNRKISAVVDLTNQRIQGVLIDTKTLKPSTYGINYIKTYGMGLLENKNVKDITNADLNLIELNLQNQINRENRLGAKTESFLRDRQQLLKYVDDLAKPGFLSKIPAKLRPLALGTGLTIGGISAAAAADGAPIELTAGEKLAGAGTAAAAYKFRKPIIKGAKAVGRTAMKTLGPLAVPLELAFIGSDLRSGSTVPEALADVVMLGGIFRERDKRKFIEDKYGTETLNRYVAAKTPGITDVMDMPTALPALSQELQAIDTEADAYLQTLRGQRAEEFKRKSALPKPQIDAFQAAGGGIAKQAGVSSGPPPESGPNSQGLPGLLKRVRNL